MSHNVSIKDVNIRDITAVEQACSELSKELNTEIQFIKDGHIRDWSTKYSRTAEYQGEKADYVIRIPSCDFDVGLMQQSDGTYMPRHESMGGSDFGRVIGAEGGAQTLQGQSCNIGGSALGKLLQRVNVIVTEREAAQMGKTCTRHYDEKTKIMNLEIV